MTPLSSLNPRDVAAIDLGRILSRLEQKILSADTADTRLQHSSYERTRTSANLEYARTLLLRLEHSSSSSLKLPSQKASAQSSLSAQRALIKRLTDRLHDLDAHGDDDDLFYGPEDDEDILGENGPAALPAVQGPEPQKPSVRTMKEPMSVLRNRKQQPSKRPDTATSTNRESTQADLLAHNDTESATLTTSLLQLAQSLKASSTAFSTSLEADTEILDRATEGLDKNATGMEAAGKRVGLLKRMSEGKGWWGRMMLYAWIGGLWLLAILLVFAGPKLRF
ncbi:MAG: hypothetical protein ASARMPREDX12_001521 [Alectoria sarmentosa]|nr:MAG: hypothetical protein ASARMPREDX12_001521 [Alectoria sarmentosa]